MLEARAPVLRKEMEHIKSEADAVVEHEAKSESKKLETLDRSVFLLHPSSLLTPPLFSALSSLLLTLPIYFFSLHISCALTSILFSFSLSSSLLFSLHLSLLLSPLFSSHSPPLLFSLHLSSLIRVYSLSLGAKIESLTAREAELRLMLEDVQKQIAEAEAQRKELSKAGDNEKSALSVKRRIAESGLAGNWCSVGLELFPLVFIAIIMTSPTFPKTQKQRK